MRTSSLPHAYAAGHLANSASLLLPVSNLTNLLAFAATGLSFLHFTGLMFAPWLVAVAVEFAVLRWLFRRELAKPAGEPVMTSPPLPVVAVVVVGLVVVGFGVASLLGVSPIWPAAIGVVVLAARQLVRRTTRVTDLVAAADLPFALFVLSLAVVVLALLHNGVEQFLHTVLPDGDALPALLIIAGVSALLANLLNNLPATLALLPVLAVGGAGPVLAMLIGVNVGPNLTYVGSLATLLWRRVLHERDEEPALGDFTRLGIAAVPATVVAATVALWVTLKVIGG
jgi:arsenical pump membrane protein